MSSELIKWMEQVINQAGNSADFICPQCKDGWHIDGLKGEDIKCPGCGYIISRENYTKIVKGLKDYIKEVEKVVKILDKPDDIPKQLEQVDLEAITDTCENYLQWIISDNYHEDKDRDHEHIIYETVLEAVYGEDIWEWVNKQIDEKQDIWERVNRQIDKKKE